MVLLLSQLALRFEYQPLRVGNAAVLEVQLAPGSFAQSEDLRLEPSPGIRVETDPLRDQLEHAVYWRIRPRERTPAVLHLRWGSQAVEKLISIAEPGNKLLAVSARRPGSSLLDRLLNPGEIGFDSQSPIRAIVVHHSPRATPILGLSIPWWLTFLISSTLAAFMASPILKVRF